VKAAAGKEQIELLSSVGMRDVWYPAFPKQRKNDSLVAVVGAAGDVSVPL